MAVPVCSFECKGTRSGAAPFNSDEQPALKEMHQSSLGPRSWRGLLLSDFLRHDKCLGCIGRDKASRRELTMRDDKKKVQAHNKGEGDFKKCGGLASNPITEIFHPSYAPPKGHEEEYAKGWKNAKKHAQ